MSMLSPFLHESLLHINQQLQHLFMNLPSPSAQLREAMQYSSLAGGKRIRALLIYATGDTFDVPRAHLDAPAIAVELMHTYSLIHDDLPAMDNDNLRRGKPTCHVAFDEATAILAGDALQSLAFEHLSHPHTFFTPAQQLAMIHTISTACGIHGMASGQQLDLASLGQTISLEHLKQIHQLKTGALITACVKVALLAHGHINQEQAAHMQNFASHLGLAFQVQDDLLDVIGDKHQLGKHTGMDAKRNKPNYPSILGVEASKALLKQLVQEAFMHLRLASKKTQYLEELTHLVVERLG